MSSMVLLLSFCTPGPGYLCLCASLYKQKISAGTLQVLLRRLINCPHTPHHTFSRTGNITTYQVHTCFPKWYRKRASRETEDKESKGQGDRQTYAQKGRQILKGRETHIHRKRGRNRDVERERE